jgi:hypothetical protein
MALSVAERSRRRREKREANYWQALNAMIARLLGIEPRELI